MASDLLIKPEVWRGRNVLVTGHTGFKGGWLALWLQRLGANVTGFALPPPTTPSLFAQARIAESTTTFTGDVRELAAVDAVFEAVQPEVIFHLAAQSLVLESYRAPVETFHTNVMGTVHVLDAARRSKSTRAVVVITTDKCYENREWDWPYRESDTLGGHDAYANSKACAELATAAYVSSFFEQTDVGVATARAGNVIGGGDWADNRLIPDAARAFIAERAVLVRNPTAVRPWQHVLEPLGAYIALAERLRAEPRRWGGAWNVGPDAEDALPVRDVVATFAQAWGGGAHWNVTEHGPRLHESKTLRLDTAKIRSALGWRPRLRLAEALHWTANWYKDVAHGADAASAVLRDIERFERLSL